MYVTEKIGRQVLTETSLHVIKLIEIHKKYIRAGLLNRIDILLLSEGPGDRNEFDVRLD